MYKVLYGFERMEALSAYRITNLITKLIYHQIFSKTLRSARRDAHNVNIRMYVYVWCFAAQQVIQPRSLQVQQGA